MKSRYLLSLIAAAVLALPVAAPASQPEVTLAELQPAVHVAASPFELTLLLADPYREGDFGIVLPQGHTTLDLALPAEPQG